MAATGPDRIAADLALARRCLAGDDEAWRGLIAIHRPVMLELARRIVAHTAADVVDAAIADIWERRKLARYEGRSSLATWLGAVAINAALNAKRAAASHLEFANESAVSIDPPASEPAADRDATQLSHILYDAIAVLPAPSRLLVLWHYEQDLTLDAIAILLKRSKSTLSRSLASIRQQILREADRMAHQRLGISLADLRSGHDLGQLELDLRAACAAGRDGGSGLVSKP